MDTYLVVMVDAQDDLIERHLNFATVASAKDAAANLKALNPTKAVCIYKLFAEACISVSINELT